MNITRGNGKTEYGPGVLINLEGYEVATAIRVYLAAHNIEICGPATVKVNGESLEFGYGTVYVDPSGFVIDDGKEISGRTGETLEETFDLE